MAQSIFVAVVVLSEIFWFFQLINLLGKEDGFFRGKYDKLCWTGVLLFANIAGTFAYFIFKLFNAPFTSDSYESLNIKPDTFKKIPHAPRKCPNCGESFFYNTNKCLSCGWTYKNAENDEESDG